MACKTLGINPGFKVSPKTLRKAYLKAIKAHQPDSARDFNSDKCIMRTERSKRISEAWSILKQLNPSVTQEALDTEAIAYIR